MRKLLLGAAAISLSGCSFLGFGGGSSHYGYQPAPSYGSQGYGYTGTQCAPTHAVLSNGNCLSRINAEGGIGLTYNMGNDIITGDEATAPGTDVRNVDFDEAYDRGLRSEAGLSYALNPNTKVLAMGFIEEAKGAGNINFGDVGGQAFTGELSDYEAIGVELGVRHYFNPTPAPFVRSVRPYVEGRLGASYQDAIVINNAQLGGAAIGTGTLGLYESGWVPSAAGLVGVETPVTANSTIGLETGLRYTGEQDADTSATFGPGPFEGLNEGSSRWSVPVMLRGRYRF
jgi:hypothetical protein